MDYEPRANPDHAHVDEAEQDFESYAYAFGDYTDRSSPTTALVIVAMTLVALIGMGYYSYSSYHTDRSARQAARTAAAPADRPATATATPPTAAQEEETADVPAAAQEGAPAPAAAAPPAAATGPAGPPPALGETMPLVVIAQTDVLSPIRLTVDADVRRPYWVELGDSVVFQIRDRVILEGPLDQAALRMAGIPWPTGQRDEEGRIVITREDVQRRIAQ